MDRNTICIIEDDVAVRESLVAFLGCANFHTECFEAAEEYLHAEVDQSPACFIVDVRLPGMSGIDFVHQLISNGTQVPIIVVSGLAGRYGRRRGDGRVDPPCAVNRAEGVPFIGLRRVFPGELPQSVVCRADRGTRILGGRDDVDAVKVGLADDALVGLVRHEPGQLALEQLVVLDRLARRRDAARAVIVINPRGAPTLVDLEVDGAPLSESRSR